MFTTVHGIIVAGSTEFESTSTTVEQGNRAAIHAFPVTKLVAVLLASLFAEPKFLICAWIAQKILLRPCALGLQSLGAVFHTAEVGLLALRAEIICAIVLGKSSQIVEVDIAFGDHAALFVIALFNRFIYSELVDLCLEV